VTRPVRVGLVIGQLTTGGAEGQLLLLCRGLDRERFQLTVYCLSDQTAPYGEPIAASGIPVRVISGSRLARARALRQWLAADRIDVVHAWLFIANGFAWVASGRRALVTSARNCKRQGRVLDLLNRRAFAASAAIVVNSEDVGNYIAAHYAAPRERMHVIYNAIDTQRFHPTSSTEPGLGPIVTVGRLVAQKNHDLFLRAAQRLTRAVPGLRFVIVGDGPLRPALTEQAAQLGIAEQVHFAGERTDVEDLLRGASLFWLTSRWEGLPNVVLEALACGVPVIATDVGGTRELIRSGVDGFVVSGEDEEGFVRYSRELLTDGARRQRFRVAARARAEEFSVVKMVGAFARLYDAVAEGVA
jgi:glycosyltransferase involved in cell wall biosynthesis